MLETIKKVAKGYVKMREENGLIYFDRFTDKQREVFLETELRFHISGCTPGVCLDFITDSRHVKIEYKVVCSTTRHWMYFDAFIDDTLYRSFGCGDHTEGEGTEPIAFDLPETGAPHHVTVYLPHLQGVAISRLEVDDDAYIEAAPDKKRSLLCIGDSITQGMDATYPSFTFPTLLARRLDMNVLNQGVGGHSYRVEFLAEIPDYKADIILLALGTNDWNFCKTREMFVKRADDFFAKYVTLYDKEKTYVITPVWRFDMETQKGMGTLADVIEIILETCKRYGITNIIDGMTIAPNDDKYFPGNKNVHYDDLGYVTYANSLARILKDKA